MTNIRSNKKRHNNRLKKDNYIPPYSNEILSMSIAGLGFSDATLASLQSANIVCIKDIVTRRATEMYRIQNFGKKNLLEVSGKLSTLGVDFRPLAEPVKEQVAREAKEQTAREAKEQTADKRGKRQPVTQKPKNPARQANTQQVSNKQVGKQTAKKDVANGYYKKLFEKPKFRASTPILIKKDKFEKMQRAGKWGFRDSSGKEVIPPIYDEVFNFKEDLACVEKNGLFGYINRKNELVIPYKYECASSFSEGLACVSLEGKCGFIDKEGTLVLPMIYDAATSFYEDVSRAKVEGKWGLLKKDGSFSLI